MDNIYTNVLIDPFFFLKSNEFLPIISNQKKIKLLPIAYKVSVMCAWMASVIIRNKEPAIKRYCALCDFGFVWHTGSQTGSDFFLFFSVVVSLCPLYRVVACTTRAKWLCGPHLTLVNVHALLCQWKNINLKSTPVKPQRYIIPTLKSLVEEKNCWLSWN